MNYNLIKFIAPLGISLIWITTFFIHIVPNYQSKRNIFFFPSHILGGDEPHYMVTLSSLLKDKDIDLKNNYENSLNGKGDAGYFFRGQKIDHHTFFVHKEKKIPPLQWSGLFDWWTLKRYTKDNPPPQNGLIKNQKNPQSEEWSPQTYDLWLPIEEKEKLNLNDFYEVPQHPLGIVLIPSLFLYFWKDSDSLDSYLLFFILILNIIGLFHLYLILKEVCNNSYANALAIVSIGLGTPIWIYTKSYFPESFQWPIFIIAFYHFLFRKNVILSGILLGIGVLLKYTYLVFPGVLGLTLLFRKDIKKFLYFSIPITLSIIFYLVYHHTVFGSIFYGHDKGGTINIVKGFSKLFFSLDHGFLVFSPILLFAFFNYQNLRNLNKLYFWSSFFIILINVVGWSFWYSSGGYCYGNRFLIPILPLFALPIAIFIRSKKSQIISMLFYITLIISIMINATSAFTLEYSISRHPFATVVDYVKSYFFHI